MEKCRIFRWSRPSTACGLAAVLLSTGAHGEEPPGCEPPRSSATNPVAFELGGFLDLYFAWNPDSPAGQANFYPGTGNSAKRANELAINLAAIEIQRPAAPLGFKLVLATGTAMDVLHSGDPTGEGTSQDLWRHLYQASMSYATDWGRGVVFELGVYPSHIGFESPLPRDNWNYSQGLAGQFTPSYQTGIKAVLPLSAQLTAELHAVNGWQTLADLNQRKSVGGKLAWEVGALSLSLSGWYGAELADADRIRRVIDLIAVGRIHPKWTMALEAYVGDQERATGGTDDWSLAAGWLRFAPSEAWAFAARAERLRDAQGAISGFAQTWKEATLTLERNWATPGVGKRLALKLEGRVDRSDVEIFERHAEPTRHQRLVVFAAIVSF